MNKEQILELIDERATELERRAYDEVEKDSSHHLKPNIKAIRLSGQAESLRNIQKEIRNG